MNGEQTTSDPPCLEESDPTNARLAALMVEQTRRILDGLARLEKPIAPLVHFADMREALIRSLTTEEGRNLLPRWIVDEIPSDWDSIRSNSIVKILVDHFAHAAIVFATRVATVEESATPPSEPDTEADEAAEPVIEFTPVSWEEFKKRIEASLAKSAKKEREMTAMLDAVMEAGLLAATEKGAVALALAKVFAGMIPDGKPIHEIPEGWAPVALAINPATGEFLTIAGPRSEPDGRVEALETMLARQLQNTVASTIGAVREAGRPQPKPRDEARPIAKPRDLARPQPKPGEPDYVEYVITGPIDEFSCETCRQAVGERVSPNAASDYLGDIQGECKCENGCRLTIAHPDEPGAVSARVKKLEEGSEGE